MIDNKNTYVIIPPEAGSSVMLVKTKMEYEKESVTAAAYKDCFDLVLLNTEGALSDEDHQKFLNEILPSLAMILQVNFENQAKDLVDKFILEVGEESEAARDVSEYDYTSALMLVLGVKLNDFLSIRKKEGERAADEKMPGFLELLINSFTALPYVQVSSILGRFSKFVQNPI